MKKRIKLIAGLAILAMVIALFWPDKKPALEFVGYKWDSTNNSWYAEMSLVNYTRKTIYYVANDGGEPVLIYQFKVANTWKTGAFRFVNERISKWSLEPARRLTVIVPLKLTPEQLYELDGDGYANKLPQLPVPSDIPLRVAVHIDRRKSYSVDNEFGRLRWRIEWLVMKIERIFRTKRATWRDDMEPIYWCPEMLSVPTNPPPQNARKLSASPLAN